jgi:DNA polymerase-3 subunit alpha
VSREGLEERLTQLLDKNAPDYDEQYKIYHDRLDFELKIINQMGFPGLLFDCDGFYCMGKK